MGQVRDSFGAGGDRNKALRIPQFREEAGHKGSITALLSAAEENVWISEQRMVEGAAKLVWEVGESFSGRLTLRLKSKAEQELHRNSPCRTDGVKERKGSKVTPTVWNPWVLPLRETIWRRNQGLCSSQDF